MLASWNPKNVLQHAGDLSGRICGWLSEYHVMGLLHGKHMWPALSMRVQQNGGTFQQKQSMVQMFKEFPES